MNLEKKIFIVPIVFNLIVITFLYIDFLLPTTNIDKDDFSSFYNVVNSYPSVKGGGGKEVLSVLECKSGKTYRVPSFPIYSDEELIGQKIEIEKTFFLGKPKLVKFVEIKKQVNISILSENIIIVIYIISMIISLLNLFFEIKFLEIPLAFSFVFIFFTAVLYLFYF